MQSIVPELMVWNEPLKIRQFDVDLNGRATSASLCSHFLEAAWNHAEALGVGFTHLSKLGKLWVLSRMRIEAKNYPTWGSEGTLRTWPRAVTHVFAMRDFEILNKSGAVMIAGTSAWLVLDMATRRPQRISKILPGFEEIKNRATLGRDPEKVPDNDVWERSSSATVHYTDLDVNGHMNSSHYISALLNDYPIEFHRSHWVSALEINYLEEARAGDALKVQTHSSEPSQFSHSIVRENGDEVCRAQIEWKANTP